MSDMRPYIFGRHAGHLSLRAAQIAGRYGAKLVRGYDAVGRPVGWFELPRPLGPNADTKLAAVVMEKIGAAGGVRALQRKGREKPLAIPVERPVDPDPLLPAPERDRESA